MFFYMIKVLKFYCIFIYSQDPIGWFLHTTQQLVSKAEHIYGEDDQDSDPDLEALPKLSTLLENLASKFADMDLNDMNVEKNLDCNKNTVEGQVNFYRVESLKNCYEALIEYVLTHGADKEQSRAGLVIRLLTKHHDLQEVHKSSGMGKYRSTQCSSTDHPASEGVMYFTKYKNCGIILTTTEISCKNFNQSYVSGSGGTKAGGGGGKRKKAADDTIAKAKKAPEAPFDLPPHAFSLKALSLVLHMILM